VGLVRNDHDPNDDEDSMKRPEDEAEEVNSEEDEDECPDVEPPDEPTE